MSTTFIKNLIVRLLTKLDSKANMKMGSNMKGQDF